MAILGDHHVNEAILDEMPALTQAVKVLARRFEHVTAMRCADIYEMYSPEAARKIRAEFGVAQQTAADAFFDHLAEEILKRLLVFSQGKVLEVAKGPAKGEKKK